jgi:hypothetical protein
MKADLAMLMSLALLSQGCQADRPAAAWLGSAELRDSVWVVTNPDTPVFDSTQASLTAQWAVELAPDSAVSWVAPGCAPAARHRLCARHARVPDRSV